MLFALISIAIFLYTNRFRRNADMVEESKKNETGKMEENVEKFSKFAKAFLLTPREQQVLKILLTSDDSVQDMAE